MDAFLEVADQLVIYQIRSNWFKIAKLYNEIASENEATISMAFILLALNDKDGSPVTAIAPRLGMEPNSLSRILKSMEEKELIFRAKDGIDKRKTFIKLTGLGKEKRKLSLEAVFNLEKEITNAITEDELQGFFKVMKNIQPAIEKFSI